MTQKHPFLPIHIRPPQAGWITHSPIHLAFFIFFLLISCGKKTPPTIKAYEKPDTPVLLRAMHRESNIILFWSHEKRENLKGFYLLKSEGDDFKRIAFIDKAESSYTDNVVRIDTIYKYKIIAQSIKDVLSNDSNVVSVKLGRVPPSPDNISFKIGYDTLTISWKDPGSNVSYNVYKSSERDKYSITPFNSKPLKTASFSDNLELSKPVYYRVRAVIDSNGFENEGPASDEIEVNPMSLTPSTPRGLEAVSAVDKLVLIWKENPEKWVAKYRIYRKINDKEGFKLIGESVTPVFTVREKTGIKHLYRVTAVGPSKESGFSEIVPVDF